MSERVMSFTPQVRASSLHLCAAAHSIPLSCAHRNAGRAGSEPEFSSRYAGYLFKRDVALWWLSSAPGLYFAQARSACVWPAVESFAYLHAKRWPCWAMSALTDLPDQWSALNNPSPCTAWHRGGVAGGPLVAGRTWGDA